MDDALGDPRTRRRIRSCRDGDVRGRTRHRAPVPAPERALRPELARCCGDRVRVRRRRTRVDPRPRTLRGGARVGGQRASRVTIGAPLEQAFTEGGLRPSATSYVVARQVTQLQQTAPASISIAGAGEVSEEADGPTDVLPVLYFASGGAVLDAPIVYAGWGLSPTDHPETAPVIGQFPVPTLGTVVKSWADDYAAVDVRGKVAVVLRMPNIQVERAAPRRVQDFETTVTNALKRGAVAVVYIDPFLPTFPVTTSARARSIPTGGWRDPAAGAAQWPAGVRAEPPRGGTTPRPSGRIAESDLGRDRRNDQRPDHLSPEGRPERRPDLAAVARPRSRCARARRSPVARVSATPRSLVGGLRANPLVCLIWAVMPATRGSSRPATDALAAYIRSLAGRTGAVSRSSCSTTRRTAGNARQVAERLGRTRGTPSSCSTISKAIVCASRRPTGTSSRCSTNTPVALAREQRSRAARRASTHMARA